MFKKVLAVLLLTVSPVFAASNPPEWDVTGTTLSGGGTYSAPINVTDRGGTITLKPNGDPMVLQSTVTGTGTVNLVANGTKVAPTGSWTGFTGTFTSNAKGWVELRDTYDLKTVDFVFDSTNSGDYGMAFLAPSKTASDTYYIGTLSGSDSNDRFQPSSSSFIGNLYLSVGSKGEEGKDYIFNGKISKGPKNLGIEKTGAGTWTLTNSSMDYNLGTKVSGGTLRFLDAKMPDGAVTISAGAKLQMDTATKDLTMGAGSTVTGSGTLSHTGNNKLVIQSNFTGFTGTVSNEGGRYIELYSKEDGTNVSTSANAIYVASNPSGGQGQAFAFVAKTTDVSTPVVFEIGALIGTCQSLVSGSSSTSGAQVLLKVGSNGETLISNEKNVLSGTLAAGTRTLSLEKVGTNTWTLTGSNTYSGSTTITGGTLKIGNGGTSGNIASTEINLGKAGTLEVNRSDSLTWRGTQSGEKWTGIKLTTETNGTPATPWTEAVFNPTTDAKYITANLVKNGAGKLQITLASNTPTETFRRAYGYVDSNTAVVLNSNIEIGGGTLEIKYLGGSDLAIRGKLTGTGTLLHSDGRKLMLFGDNTGFKGRITSTSGRYIELYSAKAASADAVYEVNGSQGLAFVANGENDHFKVGAIIGNNSSTILTRSGASSSSAVVEVGSVVLPDSENVFKGDLGNNSAVSYVKVGDGQWTLTGTSTHTAMTVEEGTLYLTSTANFTKSPVTVNEGGTLILQGTLAKNLTVNGDLEIDFTQGGTTQEANVAGNVLFGDDAKLFVNVGDMTVDDLWGASYKLTSGNSYDLAPLFNEAVADGRAPSYMMLNADGSIGLNYNAVPEPATWLLLVLGAVGLLLGRRFQSR